MKENYDGGTGVQRLMKTFVPIMGRVTINGSVVQFSCKLTIAKTMWDAKGNRAKG